jgi:hypothetical protein
MNLKTRGFKKREFGKNLSKTSKTFDAEQHITPYKRSFENFLEFICNVRHAAACHLNCFSNANFCLMQ